MKRNAVLLGTWIALVWFGVSAINHHEENILGLYVMVAAFALTTLFAQMLDRN